MTRRLKKGRQEDVEEAFQKLYGDSFHDLTPCGYIDAIRRLRQVDQAASRQVERILDPFLTRWVFRRRQRSWHETSEGMKARLKLLPDNPHLAADMNIVRKALCIPSDQIQASTDDPAWQRLRPQVAPEKIRQVVDGNIAARWIELHRRAAYTATSGSELADELPEELRKSAIASGQVDLNGAEWADWMRRPPEGPPPFDCTAPPLHWAAAKLVERHRLPWGDGLRQ